MKVNQLKAGVILSYGYTFIQTIILLFYTPIMIRMLGKSEYGLYSLVYSTVSYLAVLNVGFASAFVRYYSRYKALGKEDKIENLNGMFLIIFCILGVIALICGSVLDLNVESIFKNKLTIQELQKAKILVKIMVFNISILFPSAAFDAIITANEKYIFQKVVKLISTIVNPFLVLPLLFMGYKSIALVLVTTIINIFTVCMNIWYCKEKLKAKFRFNEFDFSLMKEIGIFSFFIFLNSVTDQVNWNVDKFLLGMYKGTKTVAVYDIASQINSFFISISTVISAVFIPKVNRISVEKDANEKFTDLFIKVGRIQFFVIFLFTSGFIIFGKYFIKIWAGKGYEESYYVMNILVLSVSIPVIQNIGIAILRAINMQVFRSLLGFSISIVNIIISIYLCKSYGAVGAAIGTAISLIIGEVFIMNIYYYKQVKLDMIKFWGNIVRILPSMFIPVIFGGLIFRFYVIDTISKFILFVIVYTIIFMISIWNLGLNDFEKNLIIEPLNKLLKNKQESI